MKLSDGLTHRQRKRRKLSSSEATGRKPVWIEYHHVLENNLKLLRFVHVHTFQRRKGYPDGMLKMYIKNL